MAKSQAKSGRETRKSKTEKTGGKEKASGKKVPRYLRDGAQVPVEVPSFKPTKKAPPSA